MIVCLCNKVTDRDIHRAASEGVQCFESLQDQTGVASCCGCCHDCARETFEVAVQQLHVRRRHAHGVAAAPAVGTALPLPAPLSLALGGA